MNSLARLTLAVILSLAALTASAESPAIPPLEVKACAGCRVPPVLLQLIGRGYVDSADYEGVRIDTGRPPLVLVVEQVEWRDANAASLFGPLAGRDYIRARLNLGEREIVLEDSASSSFADINSITEGIGIEAQKAVTRALAAP